MFFLNKINRALKSFRRDEAGNMAMIFALSATAICIGVGSAVDYTTLSHAKNKSQSVADTMALQAAIFVKNNDRFPKNNEEGYMNGRRYSAAELGQDFRGWVEGGAENVFFTVHYNDDTKEAVVTVEGATVPSFMQVTGKSRLPFKSVATVSYMEIEDKFPASIALVMDNSGSMRFDDKKAEDAYQDSYGRWWGEEPAGSSERIAGLKTSVIQFKKDLKSRLGAQTSTGHRYIRMGMLPYSSDIIEEGRRDMRWGYLPNTKINAMVPDGGTNSSPPMEEVRKWMEGEEDKHLNEAERMGEEYVEPLKFVIFMTDGQNTVGNYMLIPGPSGRWYKQTNEGWYVRSSYEVGYTQGWLVLATDSETKLSCTQMKNDGVEIFTIGYALEPGPFLVNGWSDWPEDRAYYVKPSVQSAAYNLMASCASSEDHFIKAENAEQLEAAFDRIQNAIVEELIRIKS